MKYFKNIRIYIITIIVSVVVVFLLLEKNVSDDNKKYNDDLKIKMNQNIFIDKNLDTIDYQSIVSKKEYSLIFRIPLFSCSSCVNREIITLKENMDESNFFVISNYHSPRDFLIFLQNISRDNLEVYNCSSKLTDLDSIQIPYYLLINHKLEIENQFIVDKNDASKSMKFLNKANSYFKNNRLK